MFWFWMTLFILLLTVTLSGMVRHPRRGKPWKRRRGRRGWILGAAGRLRPWKGRDALFTRARGPAGHMTRIATFSLHWQAQLAANLLRQEGIPCLVQEPGAYGSALGVNLLVPASCADRIEVIQRVLATVR
jgi:hypothetical protein